MTVAKLASIIAKREGKKHQASVGDVREILKIFLDMMTEEEHMEAISETINSEIDKRIEKKKKAKKK